MSQPLTVAITGVSTGIGAALCHEFLSAGHHVEGYGRTRNPALDGHSAFGFHDVDFSDLGAIQALSDDLDRPLDIAIFSAGSFGRKSFAPEHVNYDDFVDTLIVNIAAPLAMFQKFKPRLVMSQAPVAIMMSTGNASLEGNKNDRMLSYKISKSGLNQLVRTLSFSASDPKIPVIALNPGWVRTAMGGDNAPLSPEDAAAQISSFATAPNVADYNGQFVNARGSKLPW